MSAPSSGARPRSLIAAALTMVMSFAALITPIAATTSSAATAPGVSTAAKPDCPVQESPSGLVRDAHPVVLVHGWTGSPMGNTRTALEKSMTPGWQFKLFDYSKVATHWASRPEVAGCLATYLEAVSRAHRDAKGDGRVFVVAHSMGGIATAFALDPAHGFKPELAARIGGLVTIDTPWRGAAWGQSVYAQALSLLKDPSNKPASLFGDPASDAWVCLRSLTAPATRGNCDRPPYMPKSVPVAQIAGEITVKRSYFGFHAYDVSMGSDAIVASDSQHGYLGSATGSTLGLRTTLATSSCAISLDSLVAQAGSRFGGAIGGLSGTLLQLWADGAAMDALMADKASPALIEFTLAALAFSRCSHIGMPKYEDALDKVEAALRAQAAGPALKVTDLLNAPIPADCQHKAGTLRDGELPGLGSSQGFATVRRNGKWVAQSPLLTDLTRDGVPELVGVLYCSAGGVDWPHRLLVYQGGPRLLGSFSLGDITPAEHGFFTSIAPTGADLKISWETFDGCCSNHKTFTATVHWDGNKVVVRNVKQSSGPTSNPADWVITTDGIGPALMDMKLAEAVKAGVLDGPGQCAWDPQENLMVGTVLSVSMSPEGRIKRLYVEGSSKNHTRSGIALGSTLQSLQAAYGSSLVDAGPSTEVFGNVYGVRSSSGNYVAFLVDGDTVSAIQVSNVRYSPNNDIYIVSESAGC